MKAKSTQLPLTFEEPVPAAPAPPLVHDPVEAGAFVHAPHAVFLSWTAEQQLRYCAARDINGAIEAEEDGYQDEAEWLEDRAVFYLQEAERVKGRV